MAAIEDRVAEIADPDLRMRLQAAARSLKEHRRLGRVVEDLPIFSPQRFGRTMARGSLRGQSPVPTL